MSALCKRSTETEEGDWTVCAKQGKHDRWSYKEPTREATHLTHGSTQNWSESHQVGGMFVGNNGEIVSLMMSSPEST